MRSNLGLDRRGTIDPPWNWTTTKGRQRAVRRARTSFAGLNKKNSIVKSSKRSADIMDKDHARPEDIFLSESEKVSVNILGRHFSDSLEIVPIKKRRFLLVDSSSSPLQSSSSDDSDHLPESQPTLFQESSAYGRKCGKSIVGNKITSLNDISGEIADGACFSGISILAAAACSSEILSETIVAGNSLTGHYCKNKIPDDAQVTELQSSNEDKEQQFQSVQDVQQNCNVSIEKCSTFVSDNDEKLQCPENGENVTNSSQDVSEKTKPSTCDSRLHWDLNVVMDAWNDVVISNQLATDPVWENHNRHAQPEGLESLQHQVEIKENKCPTKHGGSLENMAGFSKDDFAQVKSESLENLDACNEDSTSDHEKAKQCGTIPAGQDLVEQNLAANSVCLIRSTEEEKAIVHQESNTFCTEVVSSVVSDVVGSSSETKLATESLEAKADMDSVLVWKTETSISQLSSDPDSGSNTLPILAPSITKLISDEPANKVLSTTQNSSEDHSLSNEGVRSPIHISSSQINEHGLQKNSGSGDMPPVHVEKASDDLFGRDVNCNSMDKCRQPGGSVSGDSDIINGLHANESSQAADMIPCPLNNHQHAFLSSNPDVLPSGMSCIEQARTELKADSNRCVDIVTRILVSDGMSGTESNVNLNAAAMSTHETVKSYIDSCVNDSSKVVANGLLNHDCGAHQVDAIQNNELENVGIIGDDDSQFEDGEFRESDGANEGESERVDYECDNRENAVVEVVSGFKDSASSAIENITCKSMDALVSAHDRANAFASSPFAVSQPSSCLSKSTSSEAGHRKRTFVDIGGKDSTDRFMANDRSRKQCNDTSAPGSHSEKMIGYSGVPNGCHNNTDPSTNLGMKLSGWDQVPVGLMHIGDSMLDTGTVKQDGSPGALNVPGDNETSERSSTPFRRGLSSRIERLVSLDESRSKARSYTRGSRSDDHGDINTKADRDTGAPKSVGRGRSSKHVPWRGREEQWLDTSNRHGPRHHDSPGYCDSPGYARSGSRNATAAAVAKVESNGFVVAADGTIVRADGAGNSAHVVRRTVNSSSQNRWGLRTTTKHDHGMERRIGNARDMSPDKHYTVGRNQSGKYGHEMARDQYRRPVPDNSILSVHRLSRRDRSFSPHRGPQRLSRSHSRSPSRTRSPHRWNSPRRGETGINDDSFFRRYSRSPKAIKERMRSPHSRPNFENHIVGYGPSSRNLASSMHSSRWFDERRDSPNHHREHEYKHSSRRSPSIKVFRSQRLDSLDLQGRLKPETHYHPLHSSKDPEVPSFSREYRCAGSDDRREYSDRYESLRPMRQYNVDNNDKRFR